MLSSTYQSIARLLLSSFYEPLPKHLISVLGLFCNVLHGLAIASRTLQPGHPAGIFPAKFRGTDRHINDGFIDQHYFTADPAAIAVLLRRRAEGFVQRYQ